MILRAAGAWVRNRRRRYHALGQPLSTGDVAWLSMFYDPALLAGVRLHRMPLHLGHLIGGITYGDTMLFALHAPASGPGWARLLFHELVHVVQYEVLGIDAFIDRYLRGWAAAGCRYRGIPLEVDAYAIEAMYCADPRRSFSVRAEIVRRLTVSG